MPNREPSNQDLLKSIQAIPVKQILGALQDLSQRVDENTTAIGEMKDKLDGVAETVEFIKENAVTRDELHEELTAVRVEVKNEIKAVKQELRQEMGIMRSDLREEIRQTRDKMIDHVDNFISLHKQQVAKHLVLADRVSQHEALPRHGAV